MFMIKLISQVWFFIACIIMMPATFVSAGGIIINNVPGGYPDSIVFTDDSGKIIKKLIPVSPVPETQITTSAGATLNRSVVLIGNSSFALMAEHTWPAENYSDNIPGVMHLYDKNANELFTFRVLNTLPKALSETGVSVFIQSPPEEWVGTEEELAKLFDVITVYDKAGNQLIKHKEAPSKVDANSIKISLNAKWLVFSVRQKRPSRLRNLVRINLETQQVYTESATLSDQLFSYRSVQNDGSLTKVTDSREVVLPDGSRKRIKKTHVLKEGIPK